MPNTRKDSNPQPRDQSSGTPTDVTQPLTILLAPYNTTFKGSLLEKENRLVIKTARPLVSNFGQMQCDRKIKYRLVARGVDFFTIRNLLNVKLAGRSAISLELNVY